MPACDAGLIVGEKNARLKTRARNKEHRHGMPGQLTKLFGRADVKIQFGRNRQSERRLLNACNTKKEKNSEQIEMNPES